MKSMEMHQQKIHLLKLEKGEELLTKILEYVSEKKIVAGYLTGIGALDKGKIGYFDVAKKKYLHNPFEKMELLSCTGNIAINKDTKEPIIHIHIILGDAKGNCIGGHLVEGYVSVTAEIYLVETKPLVYRTKDELTDLHLLSPKN
ncbi:MAG: PPC domain-containing DNA-binding protein [Asgard group archaeon]|nr:PPC domain-containing DNA-binding protein [Asgard group archaeon]